MTRGLRTAPLSAALALAASPLLAEPVRATFLCPRGVTIDVVFDGDSAVLTYRGTSVTLTQAPTGSGYLYTDGRHSLRGKGAEAVWTDAAGVERICRDQGDAMQQPQVEPPVRDLSGTSWRLVHFQSSDDAIGTVVPPRAERYTMTFRPDGGLELRLDCNRANGRWSAKPAQSSGPITLTGGAMTRAFCGEAALDSQIARDLSRIRTFVFAGERLALALEADGGLYLWEPAAP
jgi:membrane-bound inhibitor of C-type lysozyme/heat shock protein HslJ